MEPIRTLILPLSFLVVSVAWANPTPVTPSGIELERLADDSITPPGIEGILFIDMPPPIVCNGGALFHGTGSLVIRTGVYLAPAPSELTVVANPGVPVPGSNNTFQRARDPVCVGQRVVFLGDDDITPSSTGESVYMWADGVITPLIEQGTVIGNSTIRSFTGLTANKFGVAMRGDVIHPSFSEVVAVMPYGEEAMIIADEVMTVLPGQTTVVSSFGTALLFGSDLIFTAATQLDRGIYRWSQGQGISLIADTNTPAPVPGGGNFFFFDGQFATLRDGLVFGAGYGGGLGLFIWNGFEVRPLILPGDVAEDGEVLTAVGLPSGDGSLLSFSARTSDNPFEAIYVRTYDGRTKRILGLREPFNGAEIDMISADADRTTVALRVSLYDGSGFDEAIYRVSFTNPLDVPVFSPSGIVALVLILTLAGLWVLRRIGTEPCVQAPP